MTVPKSAPSAIGGGVAGDEIAGYGKEAGDAAEVEIRGRGRAAAYGEMRGGGRTMRGSGRTMGDAAEGELMEKLLE